MLTIDTTVPSWGKEHQSFISNADAPTSSLSPSKFLSNGIVMSSVAAAMAMVALAISPVITQAPTNSTTELARYSQNPRSDNQLKLANYKVVDDQSFDSYVNKHPGTIIFLEKIHPIIIGIFDKVLIELTSWTSPVDEETQLYLTVHSGMRDEDALMDKEIALFNEIEGDSLLREGLTHVVIAIR